MDRYRKNFLELSKLIYSWGLIQGADRNTFDSLTGKILDNLYEEQKGMKNE